MGKASRSQVARGAGTRIGEPYLNTIIAEMLDKFNPSWTVRGQPLGAMTGNEQPDILIESDTAAPVIVETEIFPARTVEQDAKGRLGLKHKSSGMHVRSILAVRIPSHLTALNPTKIRDEMFKTQDFEYVAYCPDRYPDKGWVKGSVYDITTAVQSILTPATQVTECINILDVCMNDIENDIDKLSSLKKQEIAFILNQPPGNQTWKMAGLIISNAMMFHDTIASHVHTKKPVQTLAELNLLGGITQKQLLDEWDLILSENYAPIFEVARHLLATLGAVAGPVLNTVYSAVSKIQGKRMQGSADMYGELFQRVIKDRIYLASYYTLPQSAALIASLVVPPPGDSLYKDNRLLDYHIADFACGTGILLSSVYREIIKNYNATEYTNPADLKIDELHTTMMEKCIIGLDVVPIATHLTVSTLATLFPSRRFRETNIKKMPIGKQGQAKDDYRFGSLDLTSKPKGMSLSTGINVVRGQRHGSTTQRTKTGTKKMYEQPWSVSEAHHHVGDDTCNLIVINPPFVRATNQTNTQEGDAVPPWAAFGAPADEQIQMGKIASKNFAKTCAHGHAGLASFFIAICDQKIKQKDGQVALILPSTVSDGISWKAVRDLFKQGYDITVISIAAHSPRPGDCSFSSDTGMAEVILLGSKKPSVDAKTKSLGTFISLRRRPQHLLESVLVAKAIKDIPQVNKIESCRGGTALMIGGTPIGDALECPLDAVWRFVNVIDPLVEQHAFALPESVSAKFTTLGDIFSLGPHALDIMGNNLQGPFIQRPLYGNPKYLALWKNRQAEQQKMTVPPDTKLEPKSDASEAHIGKVWKTATRTHMNINPRFTSNSLIASYTDTPTVGGSTWPSIIMQKKYEKAFTVWCNSTFGVILFWSIAGKQQLGRGRSSRTAIKSLQIPNFQKMTTANLKKFDMIFEKYHNKSLDRVKNLWRDPVRISIDNKICNILDIKVDMDDLRTRFCMEPSISGGKPEQSLIKKSSTSFVNIDAKSSHLR